MKQISVVLNVVLAISIIVLYILFFSNNPSTEPEKTQQNTPKKLEIVDTLIQGNLSEANIVFINTDSLMNNYKYTKVLSENIDREAKRKENEFKVKQDQYQKDVEEAQRTISTLSPEAQQKMYQYLQQSEYELAMLQQQLQNELMQKQLDTEQKLYDTITKVLKQYSIDENLDYVLGYKYGDANILYGKNHYDITNEIIKILNQRYSNQNKK